MSVKRLGPRGAVGRPRVKAANAFSFVIRWTGYQIGARPRYLLLHRGKIGYTANLLQAKRFSTRDAAIRFCKESIRTCLFGGNWQAVTKIEEVELR